MFTQIGVIDVRENYGSLKTKEGKYPLLAYVDKQGVVIDSTIHCNVPAKENKKDDKLLVVRKLKGLSAIQIRNQMGTQYYYGTLKYITLSKEYEIIVKWKKNSRQKNIEKVYIVKK
jgi:hypothetical protein